MISVLIPVRNCVAWIEDALRSMANQTVSPDEIIVADDASTDGTPERIESLGLPGVTLLRSSENRGISTQLNRMIALAQGRYLVRMDGDDISHPQRLQKQLAAMDARSLGIIGSHVRRFGATRTKHRFAFHDSELKAGLLFSTPFCHPSVVIDRDRIGPFQYDPGFDMAEDYHLWVRLRTQATFGNVPEILVNWRIHDRNVGVKIETADVQRRLAGEVRNMLLDSYGISLTSGERLALESRARSDSLDLAGNQELLSALTALAKVPEDRILAPRSALLNVLAAQWNLSCLFSAWKTPGVLRLWWTGCRELSATPSPLTFSKLFLKSILGNNRSA
jgi:glycosyltransferase involved in cell wall biosynthesis